MDYAHMHWIVFFTEVLPDTRESFRGKLKVCEYICNMDATRKVLFVTFLSYLTSLVVAAR